MGRVFAASNVTHSAMRALNYVPEVERLRRPCGEHDPVRLGDIATIGRSYGCVFTRVDCDRPLGVELLSQADIFAAEPFGRHVRLDALPMPEDQKIRRWDVLVCGAGQMGESALFGRSMIADGRLDGSYIGPDNVKLTFRDPGGDLSLFAYSFLCSNAGVRAMQSTVYGTSIPRTRLDLVSNLHIPIADDGTVARVAALIRTTVTERERYLTELRAARKVLEDLPEMREAHAMCADRKARCVAWGGELRTMRAWTVAAVGGAHQFLQRAWSGRVADLLVPQGAFVGQRFVRVPCEAPHGIELASQRDVFMIRRNCQRIVAPSLPRHLLHVDSDTIVVACDGQLGEGTLFGKVEMGAMGLQSMALTQHLLRLKPRKNAEALYAFLSTRIGHALLRSTAVGTSIPTMRADLVLSLPVPDLSEQLNLRIAAHVRNAIHSRRAADAAEREAIRIIEEEVLPTWLS